MLATHPLLTIALIETMKRFGRFPLHAAGLALNGQGVLVPGASGAGKSTTSVTLVRAGFDFLADDTVFLTCDGTGIWVDGFPDEVDVTDNTVGMIPELAHLAGLRCCRVGTNTASESRRSSASPPWPAVAGVPRCPRRWWPGPARSWSRWPRPRRCLALLPNVMMTEPAATQAHLDMLAELVRVRACRHSGWARTSTPRRPASPIWSRDRTGALRRAAGQVGRLLVELTRRARGPDRAIPALLDQVPADPLVELARHHRVPGVVYRSLVALGRRRADFAELRVAYQMAALAHGRCLVELASVAEVLGPRRPGWW